MLIIIILLKPTKTFYRFCKNFNVQLSLWSLVGTVQRGVLGCDVRSMTNYWETDSWASSDPLDLLAKNILISNQLISFFCHIFLVFSITKFLQSERNAKFRNIEEKCSNTQQFLCITNLKLIGFVEKITHFPH